MVETEIAKYVKNLPDNMHLKKKIIKGIMKNNEPLTQKEMMDLFKLADWTNLRRVLKELLDEGLVVKKRIGARNYYAKVETHHAARKFVCDDVTYFIDLFEADLMGSEKYIRVKQAIQKDRDSFETLGKITVPLSKIGGIVKELTNAQEL